MKECRRFLELEDLREDAQLYGDAVRDWQSHLHSCATCTAQQALSNEMRSALASEPAPRLTANFAARTLEAAGSMVRPAPQLKGRAHALLALNWLMVIGACAILAVVFPLSRSQSHLAHGLSGAFALSATLLALFPMIIRRSELSEK